MAWPTDLEINNAVPPVPASRTDAGQPLRLETNQIFKAMRAAAIEADAAVQGAAVTYTNTVAADKVDKVAGYGLSQANYTDAEKLKLAGLEGSHYKGYYPSLVALETAHPIGDEGDYADVDEGEGSDVSRFIWDSSDDAWVNQRGSSSAMTGAEIKTLYESQPDTNAYTDAERDKLAGVEAGAQVNDVSEAPLDGKTYGRKNGDWVEAGGVSSDAWPSAPFRVGRVVEDLTGGPAVAPVSMLRMNARFYIMCEGTSSSQAAVYTLKGGALTRVGGVALSLGSSGWRAFRLSDTRAIALSNGSSLYAVLTLSAAGALTVNAAGTVIPGVSGFARYLGLLNDDGGDPRVLLGGSAGGAVLRVSATLATLVSSATVPPNVGEAYNLGGGVFVGYSAPEIGVVSGNVLTYNEGTAALTVAASAGTHIDDRVNSNGYGPLRLLALTDRSFMVADRNGSAFTFVLNRERTALKYTGPSYFTGHNDGPIALCYLNPTECIMGWSGPTSPRLSRMSVDFAPATLPVAVPTL